MGDDYDMTRGLEASIKNMYKGERSVFFAKPEYGYIFVFTPFLEVPFSRWLKLDTEIKGTN